MINNEIIKLKFDNSFNGRLFAVQGDTGRVFNLQVFDDFSKPVDVTGMKMRMYVANSKEVSYSEGEIVEAAEGKIKVQVYNSQLKYPGKQKAQFVITDKDGQKIGSKIFDLWIEEGLEAGPTVGRNIYVDFEKINEALELIKDYDKTLEEAKEVDASLKVGINEGIEARNSLANCKKKALEIKGQLDTSKVDANKTLDDLKTTKAESETLKSDLNVENQKATENIKDLTNKIDTGKAASNELNTSIEDAKANKENLDKSNKNALATKKSLEDATTTANTTKENLSNLKSQGDTLSRDLTKKITDGNKLKSNLDASVSDAATAKSDLDASVETATSTNTTLKATDTQAKKTEALIKDLMNQLNLTKDEVSKIIASGDLSKYITDPKLQEVLKSYATKEDLSSIDVTGQLVDYAKKTEIPTKLSELQSDINNRTVTDAEKNKLANIEDGAEKNKVNSVNNKVGDVVLKLSDLENDKNFKTEVEIQELINNSTKLKKEVVTSLPSNGKDDVIYLLKNKNDTNNYYTEYMWISGKWEIIGDTKVDLSDYAKKSEIDLSKLDEKYLQYKGEILQDIDLNTFDGYGIFLCNANACKNPPEYFIDSWFPFYLINEYIIGSDGTKSYYQLAIGMTNSKCVYARQGNKGSWTNWIPLVEEKFTKEEKEKLKKLSSSRSATFVIANYDSSENSKAGADYVIQENESPCDVINSFIEKLPSYGGKIQLTEGNFIEKNDKSIKLNKNNVILEGYGESTKIIQNINAAYSEALVVINEDLKDCELLNIYIRTNNGIACELNSKSKNCKVINVTAASSNSNAFFIRGSGHCISNCKMDSDIRIDSDHQSIYLYIATNNKNSASSFYITGENHIISKCIGIAVGENDTAAFEVNEGENITLNNCYGKRDKAHIKGATYKIINSNACRINNCVGQTMYPSVFKIENSLDNIISNCIAKNDNPVYGFPSFKILGLKSSGNIINSCRITIDGLNTKIPQIQIDQGTNFNIVTGCIVPSLEVSNKGQNNVIANNIIIK